MLQIFFLENDTFKARKHVLGITTWLLLDVLYFCTFSLRYIYMRYTRLDVIFFSLIKM